MSPGLEFKTLPLVTDIEDEEVRNEIVAALKELDTLVVKKGQLMAREDSIKDRLEELQTWTQKKGFRYKSLCFTAISVAGQRTLDRMLLMENGCPAAVINASFKTGAPSIRRSFRRLKDDELG